MDPWYRACQQPSLALLCFGITFHFTQTINQYIKTISWKKTTVPPCLANNVVIFRQICFATKIRDWQFRENSLYYWMSLPVIQNPLVPSPLLFSGSSHWFQVQRKIIRKLKKKKKKCTWKKNLMVSTLKAIRENGSTFLNSYFKWIYELRTKEVCTFGSDFHRRGVWTYLILWGPLMLPFLRCPSLFLTIKKLHSLLHIYSLRR